MTKLPARRRDDTFDMSSIKKMQFRMAERGTSSKENSMATMVWDPETNTAVPSKLFPKGDSKAMVESFNQSYDTRMSNNRLQWENHLNPLTLRYAAEVYPYGGGVAPAREMGNHELVLGYLGSPATAKLIALHQNEYGFEPVEQFKTTGEPTFIQDEQLKQDMVNQLVSGFEDPDLGKIPVLPYPIRMAKGELDPNEKSYFYQQGNFRLGTLEDAVTSNPDYWNQKIPGLGASGESLDDGQKKLIWKEHIDKEITPGLYDLTSFPLTTEIEVPSLVPGTSPTIPVWNQHAEWDGVMSPDEFRKANTIEAPATHRMDEDGYVVSARAKELIGAIAADKTMIEKGLMTVDNKQETLNEMNATLKSLREGNKVNESWRDVGSGYNPENAMEIHGAAMFWGGARDQCPEFADTYDATTLSSEWNKREQQIAMKQGKWETNYLFPEFEPGLWSNVDTVNKKYLDQWTEFDNNSEHIINFPRDSYNHPRMAYLREDTPGGMDSAANLVATNTNQRDEEITYSQGRDVNTPRHRMAQNMRFNTELLYNQDELGNPEFVTQIQNPEQGLVIEDFVNDPTWKKYARIKGDLDSFNDQSGQKTRD